MKFHKFMLACALLLFVPLLILPGAAFADDEDEAEMEMEAVDLSFLFELGDNGMPIMSPYETTDTYLIGVSQIGNNFPFVVAMVEGSDQAAEDMGFEQILTDAQFDVQKQITQLEDILALDPDGIVLVALDAEAVIPQLEAAVAADIAVLTCWNDLGGPPRANYEGSVSLIGVDEVQTGRDVAQFVLELLPDGGQVAIVEGAAGFQASIERSEGFVEALEANPDIEIVASQPGNWTREDALAVTENYIQAYPDIDLIYAHDDNMAMGVVSALRDADLLADVRVIGIGGSVEGLESIANGELYGSVFDSPRAAAYICSKALIAHLEGAEIPSDIFLPRPIVTQENVADFEGEW
ncbi:MAG: sugar ABC transporter substrate-binding protein [Chloroflexi bacterium]|nr:sugar ABC transporter substrate-binding protein [Chloroflexota bacterium]